MNDGTQIMLVINLIILNILILSMGNSMHDDRRELIQLVREMTTEIREATK